MRVSAVALSLLAVFAAACAGTGMHNGDARGPDGSGDGTIESGVPAPWETRLAGYWMRQEIGNCTMAEEWFAFQPPHSLVYTLVDRNACGAHGVYVSPGRYSAADGVVDLSWSSLRGAETRRFTAALLDHWPLAVTPPYPDYKMGTRALGMGAYRRAGSSLTWHRSDERESVPTATPGTYTKRSISIDITFDKPLAAVSGSTECQMSVTMSVRADLGSAGGPSSGEETFALPCAYGPQKDRPWLRIVANGFEQSAYDGTWMDLLTQKGVWKKYPAVVSNAFYDQFKPILYFDAADPSTLFHDEFFDWWNEMLTPPPSSVE
jgi:hypothetical protein